jgi:hypothetical protein
LPKCLIVATSSHACRERVGVHHRGRSEYEEIVEEYEEEILVSEKVLEPSLTDRTDTLPAQGKPRCITFIILITIFIYLLCIYVAGNFIKTTCIYIYIYTYESY